MKSKFSEAITEDGIRRRYWVILGVVFALCGLLLYIDSRYAKKAPQEPSQIMDGEKKGGLDKTIGTIDQMVGVPIVPDIKSGFQTSEVNADFVTDFGGAVIFAGDTGGRSQNNIQVLSESEVREINRIFAEEQKARKVTEKTVTK